MIPPSLCQAHPVPYPDARAVRCSATPGRRSHFLSFLENLPESGCIHHGVAAAFTPSKPLSLTPVLDPLAKVLATNGLRWISPRPHSVAFARRPH
jgi:hypothetical protein